jgi:hypothetical protein
VRAYTVRPHEVGSGSLHAGLDQCPDDLAEADAPALKAFQLDILWKICHIPSDDPQTKSANLRNRRRWPRSGIEWTTRDTAAGCLGRQQQE